MEVSVTRDDFDKYMVPCYSPADFIPVKAQGSRVWDQQDKEYIDFAAGIAVNAFGHSHPYLNQQLYQQMQRLWHMSNGYTTQPTLALARELVTRTFADKIFFCNSGAEANEAALKLARKYAHDHFGAEKSEIIAFQRAFHGRTLFTVSVGGQPQYSADFSPLPKGITHLPFNDLSAVAQHISSRTCAVIVEPILGEGGVYPAQAAFLQGLRQLCDKHQAALIFDEVQTGVGRTGHLYAYQYFQVEPDLMTSGKGLGGGFPIGALLAKHAWAESFQVGTHGTTFGGNPLATTAANAVLTLLDAECLAGVTERHAYFVRKLQALNQRFQLFSEIRGVGLLIGAQLAPRWHGQAKRITSAAAQQGVLLLVAGLNVLRFAPALNITYQDIDQGCELLSEAIAQYQDQA